MSDMTPPELKRVFLRYGDRNLIAKIEAAFGGSSVPELVKQECESTNKLWFVVAGTEDEQLPEAVGVESYKEIINNYFAQGWEITNAERTEGFRTVPTSNGAGYPWYIVELKIVLQRLREDTSNLE